MVSPGTRRRHLSTALTTAYGDGLLSERTLAHRMDLLLGCALIEPDRLIGDLSVRVPRAMAPARLSRLIGERVSELWAARRPWPAPATLLGLDWSGQTVELTLGRDARCDIVVEHPTVSRTHASLHFRDGHWILHDLGSLNGTAVNRRSVVRCQLQPGDQLALGAQALIVD